MPGDPTRRPRWDDWCLASLLGATALLTFWQIVARHIGTRLPLPSALANASYTEELARYLFVWTMLAGAVAALSRGEHLSLELWSVHAATGVRQLLNGVHRAAWAALGVVLVVGGVRVLHLQWTTKQLTTLGWPIGWVTSAVPFVGICFISWALSLRRAK